MVTPSPWHCPPETCSGVDLLPRVILGACRPALALEGLLADPSIAAVLPGNVVVGSVDA